MRILLLCVFVHALIQLSAQNMRFSHLDQKDGLSQNTATAFLKDKEGFVWIGTQDGLNRYDGYSFTVFRRDVKDTNSLCDNFILSLAEDADGYIWIGTRNGLCAYNKSTGKFHRFYSSQADRDDFHNNVRDVHALAGGGVLCRVRTQIVKVRLLINVDGVGFESNIVQDSVRYFSHDVAGRRFACCVKNQLLICDENGAVKTEIPWQTTTKAFIFMVLTETTLYFNDSLTVLTYDINSASTPRMIYKSDAKITALQLDKEQNLWIGTKDGIRFIAKSDSWNSAVFATENKSDYFSLLGTQVECVYNSTDNLVWIGTVGGVNIYDPLQRRFSVVPGMLPLINPFPAIWFIQQAGRVTLWAGDEGLNYHLSSGTTTPKWVDLIPKNFKYSAGCFDSRGRLWLGTKNQGILILDTLNNILDKKLQNEPVLLLSAVMELKLDGHGKMWIASIGSLCTVSENDLTLRIITKNKGNQYGLKTSYFTGLERDNSGNMYVSSAHGLYHFDASDTNYVSYVNDLYNEKSLIYNIINDIYLVDSVLWIATMGSGLDALDTRSGQFTHYTTSEGLANNTIYGIEEDNQQNLWLSTNDGLVCFDPATGSSRNYTMRDGLPSNEFVINRHAQELDSEILYFGSSSGLVSFVPHKFSGSIQTVTPVLTRFRVNYADQLLPVDSFLALNSNERNISFEFSAIDFRNQDKISYSYTLEGFDTTWHDVGNSRTANFTNLPYGSYTFRVRYRIAGEPWSENVLEKKIIIATPFYATMWFRILSVLAGVTVVALIVRFISQRNLRKQLEQMRVQEQIRNEKERISRDLHDNVGAQLTYVISSLDNLSYSLNKQSVAQKESTKLEELGEFTRGTIDQLRESIWAINSEKISLSELCARWRQQLALLSDSQPNFAGKVYLKCEDEILKPGIAIEIHRIVQEAITNAFKHSKGTIVEITVKSTSDTLQFTIHDNGIGMNVDSSKSGHYGLQNMRDRSKNLHGAILFSSENGTAVKLEVPRK